MVRLWETTDGTFRCETEARPERVKQLDIDHFDVMEDPFPDRVRTWLSDNRILTFSKPWRLEVGEQHANEATRLEFPFELWDAKTGRLVVKLQPLRPYDVYAFVGNGRWIVEAEGIYPERSLRIYSAEDGRPIAELLVAL